MANGRCVGCGRTGAVRKVNAHVVQCEVFLALPYAEQIDPAEAYDRWQAEGKREAREERKVVLSDREEELHTAAEARWAKPKDILED